jgi:hypothetical protein
VTSAYNLQFSFTTYCILCCQNQHAAHSPGSVRLPTPTPEVIAALQLLLPPDQLKGLASICLLLKAPTKGRVATEGLVGLAAAFEIAAADVAALKLLPLPFGVAHGLEPPEVESVRVAEGLPLPRLDITDDTKLLALRLMLAL